jgi:thymidylate synthase
MSNIEKQYQGILRKLVLYGKEKEDRTGTGTLSYFGDQIRHDMSEGFPLLTTKKMAVKTMMTELKWFLKGDTNIKYLVDNGCSIWNGDAYKKYEHHNRYNLQNTDYLGLPEFVEKIKTDDEFAKEWGELGPIYGKQWRDWTRRTTREEKIVNPGVYVEHIDQIKNLIKEIRENSNSRRLMVNAWNVGELPDMTLPPCHYGFQCYVSEGKLSLMWNQRSVDSFLGLPFNIASYGTLLLLLCKETGLQPGELIGNLGDVHLYKNHIQQAKQQIVREPYELPTLEITSSDMRNGEFEYTLDNYQSHPPIKAPLSN